MATNHIFRKPSDLPEALTFDVLAIYGRPVLTTIAGEWLALTIPMVFDLRIAS